jgi:hypothetical protein
MPKQIADATLEEKGKEEDPAKDGKNEVEEDLNTMGIKYGRVAARNRRKWRQTVLQARVHSGL